MATIVLYTAVSLDGYIADAQGSVAWLDNYVATDYGFTEFLASIDILVMGRVTYDQVLSFGPWPYSSKRTYVLTRDSSRYDTATPENVEYFRGDVRPLAANAGGSNEDRIWLIGGARTNAQFMQHCLISELHLAIMPIMLGRGLPLTTPVDCQSCFDLVSSRQYENGVMMMQYRSSNGGEAQQTLDETASKPPA